jgi:hypothetical protein
MPSKKTNPFQVVEPEVSDLEAGSRFAERLLLGDRCPPEDATWLAPLLLEMLPREESNPNAYLDSADLYMPLLGLAWREGEGDRNASMLLVLAVLAGCVHIPRLMTPADKNGESSHWAMPIESAHRLVREMHQHDVDLNQVLVVGWPKYLLKEWTRDIAAMSPSRYTSFFQLLLRTDAVDLARVVDVTKLREVGSDGPLRPVGFSMSNAAVSWNDGVSWLDPRSLRVWVWFAGMEAVQKFFPAFATESAESLPSLAFSVAQTVSTWVGRPGQGHHPEAFDEAGVELALVMRPFFEHLDSIVETMEPGSDFQQAWLLFFRMAWDRDPTSCPPELRKRVLAAATEFLSRLRKTFAAATKEGNTEEARFFADQLSHFGQCSLVLAQHGGLWKCMKPLLLAVRSLGTRCVAYDLRYWDEFVEDKPPYPWSTIPSTMISLFHNFAGREEHSDRGLSQLRSDLCLFLLDKLTDKWSQAERKAAETTGRGRTDGDMKEPSPVWRYCMVRAVIDLGVNPEGRGHNALRWSAHHDPAPGVSEVARRGHDVLRHSDGLPEGTSPRRAILSALWWYRQAHLLGLGIQPDADGAQRTRKKELSRTKEVERAENPKHS